MTISSRLAADKRIEQAKKLILEAVLDHQKQLKGIRSADPLQKQSYQELISAFNQCRGANLYYPYIGSGFGCGSLVELMDGSVKYDMICGIGPHYLGHCNLSLIKCSIEAALSNTVMQGHLQQNSDSLELCKLLIRSSKMDHCFLASSGAMANENALKICFQKQSPANRILAFEHCFAGRTLTLSQITDKSVYREGLPTNLFVDYIPFYNYEKPEESIYRAVQTLNTYLTRYPTQHAAFFAELVQGEGGIYPGTKEFFQSLMQIVKDHGIPIIIDEVQTFARTPELFAFQYFGLEEYTDIVTIGKVSQVCATLYKKELKPRPGLLSQTFTGSTAAIRASKMIVETLLNDDFFGPAGKINAIQQEFKTLFEALAKKHPGSISGPYGIGAMIAFTLFDGEAKRTAKIAQDLFEAGVISFTAGTNPTRIRFLPPVGALTTEDITNVVDIVEKIVIKEQVKS